MVELKVSSVSTLRKIEAALLSIILVIITPSTAIALLGAVQSGNVTQYLMTLGLIIVGVVLILVYTYIDAKTPDEEKEDPDIEAALEEQDKDKTKGGG